MKKKAVRKKRIGSILIYVLIGLGLILSFAAPRFPVLIEAGYSTSLYKWLGGPISLFTGLVPFSVAECIIVGIGLFCLVQIIRGAIALFKKPKGFFRSSLRGMGKLVLILLLLYVGFNMLWGLNYSRLSFADISGLPVEPAAVEELTALAQSLANSANALRAQVAEDERGVMTLSSSIRQMFVRAETGYQRAAAIYPELGGKFGRPKGVFLSHYWSYTGTSGMYFPFTAEANVNTDMPHLLQPATAAHEMAHQRGFAREDEANYLAYLACSLHPDADFQYSGTVSALIHTMNALYRADIDAYKAVRKQYCDGLNRDLKDWRDYWAKFEGPIDRVSTNVNDSYLKANRQQDGVQSYGRMVDLLLAEYRQAQTVMP